MKKLIAITVSTIFLTSSGAVFAQIAGKSTLGVSVSELQTTVVMGRSAKKDLIGKDVVNDQKQKIGKIEDLIISPEKTASFAIIGTGGFIGIGKHDVAIPMQQLQAQDNVLVLPGASKDALKAMPAFEYASKK